MIELQNISKSFDGISVFDNISVKIPDRGIFAIWRKKSCIKSETRPE